jgi:hypothetical protein
MWTWGSEVHACGDSHPAQPRRLWPLGPCIAGARRDGRHGQPRLPPTPAPRPTPCCIHGRGDETRQRNAPTRQLCIAHSTALLLLTYTYLAPHHHRAPPAPAEYTSSGPNQRITNNGIASALLDCLLAASLRPRALSGQRQSSPAPLLASPHPPKSPTHTHTHSPSATEARTQLAHLSPLCRLACASAERRKELP